MPVASARSSTCRPLPTFPAASIARLAPLLSVAPRAAPCARADSTKTRNSRDLADAAPLERSPAPKAPRLSTNVFRFADSALTHRPDWSLVWNARATASRALHHLADSPIARPARPMLHSPTSRPLLRLPLADPNAQPELTPSPGWLLAPPAPITFSNRWKAKCRAWNVQARP